MFERRSCLEHTFGDKIQNCGMCEAPIRMRLSNGYIQTRLWRGDQTQKLPCRNGWFISTCYGIHSDISDEEEEVNEEVEDEEYEVYEVDYFEDEFEYRR
ncbi:unnamed protein product [Caenorhabditis nigoni]